MKKTGLEEHDAFHRLQNLANEKSKRLVEVAQMIVMADAALSV
jgi:AmiR/NasT family two-component response regulator